MSDGWDDWHWQERHAITTEEGLARHLRLTDAERAGVASAVARGARFGATPYYVSLADPVDPWCPVRMQIVPHLDELLSRPGERADPLGEERDRRSGCLVHRYPDRALLLVTDRCSVYCRHCTRRRLTQVGASELEPAFDGPEFEEALAYIRARPAIREVILSGGDPLLLSDERLARVLERLSEIDHVRMLRVGTRMPVSNPMRLTPELARVLRSARPVYVVTHFNHPRECTPAAEAGCAVLVDRGIPMENQAVLLRRINSSARTMIALSHRLLEMRVRPYYLHQLDVAQGLEHFRTPLARGLEILAAMRGFTGGLAVPHLAIDLPGGGGKVTIQPDYRLGEDAQGTIFRNWRGERFIYPKPSQLESSCPYEEKYFAQSARD